jgi:ethanolamine permease
LLNIAGAEVSFKFAIVVAIASLAVIAVFALMAIFSGKFSVDNLFDIAPTVGNSTFLPKGFWAIVAAMPFAMWFFLGIEELPLAAEEAHNPARDIPKAGIWGMGTLVVTALLVLVLNPGVTGASKIATSGEPLLDGFRAILPNADVAALLAAFALIGLFASLQGIMFAYGRNIYSLSRAGYYPQVLSLTGKRKTPYVALIVGAIIGYAALLWAQYGGATAGAVVLNIAVWGAVIAYMLQMISYLLLKKNMSHLKRPYKSPVGSAGAWVAGILALVIFIGQLLNPAYRQAIIAIAVVYVLGLLYFALVGRNHLVLSPEEEAAVKGHK